MRTDDAILSGDSHAPRPADDSDSIPPPILDSESVSLEPIATTEDTSPNAAMSSLSPSPSASSPHVIAKPRPVYPFDEVPSTRQVMLPWCMWLLGSWGVALWMESPIAAIRWMLFSSLFGLLIAWPTFRLSQDGRSKGRRGFLPDGSRADDLELKEVRPPRQMVLTPGVIFRDWLSMMLVFQAVIWPLRITAGWEWEQAIWINAAVASWSFLVAALIGWGCRSRTNGRRAMAAAVVYGVLFIEPLLLAAIATINESIGLALPRWTMRLSPIETLYTLTKAPGLYEPGMWRFNVIAVAAAGLLAWFFTLIAWRLGKTKSH